MSNLVDLGPLFQWASARDIRRPLPPVVRRIARVGQISSLHAIAFAQANCIGGEVQS